MRYKISQNEKPHKFDSIQQTIQSKKLNSSSYLWNTQEKYWKITESVSNIEILKKIQTYVTSHTRTKLWGFLWRKKIIMKYPHRNNLSPAIILVLSFPSCCFFFKDLHPQASSMHYVHIFNHKKTLNTTIHLLILL